MIRDQKSEIRNQKSEIRNQKSEIKKMVLKIKNISLSTIKQKILSRKKHSIVFGLIFLMILFIIFQNIEIFDSITVDRSDIILVTQTIKRLQKKLKLEQTKVKIIKTDKHSLIQKRKEFWISRRDGQANISMQKKIETAAKQSNIDLKTLGTLRITSIGNGISNGEFDISCSGKLESIIQFTHKISNAHPKIYWKRCLFRPDNIKNPKKIYLTGNLKFIIIENEDIITLLLEKEVK